MIEAGIYTAMVTPFTSDGIDEYALNEMLIKQVSGGVSGLVLCGTTGESATCSTEEVAFIYTTAQRYGLPIIAGISAASTQGAIDKATFSAQCGVDGLLVLTPYYNRPTQEGLYEHFVRVGGATGLPFLIYNVPARTGVSIDTTTVARIKEKVANCIGIKEATSDMNAFTRLRMYCGEEFLILSGDDHTFLPSMSVGANGVISVASNIVPKHMSRLLALWQEGKIAEAQKVHASLYPLFDALFAVTNPIPIKAMLATKGLCENTLRLPLVPIAEDYTDLLALYPE